MAFPSDAQFQPILLNGSPLFDPPGDESPTSTDIVGNAQFPAAYYAYDGTNVYFRLRLNADPRFKTGFQNFAWGLIFDTDGIPGTYEWLLAVNGLNTTMDLIQNTSKQFNTWNDPAEGTDGKGTPNFSRPIVNFDIARASQTTDGSNFGGNPDYFLDFFIPAATLFSFLGITETTVFRPLFFSSANANNFNKDSLQNQGFSFVSAFGDPTTTEAADVRAELAVQKTVTGPTSALTGQTLSYSGTIAVTNTGKAQATTVLVSDVFGLDQLNAVNVTGVSTGLANFNPLTKTITWNIGNLAAGATATLNFTAVGQFTTAGQRTVNTATATGVDIFTGQQIPAASSTFSAAVQSAGAVTGSVLSGATGLPLAGATVVLQTAGGAVVGSTVTTAGGGYGFTNLAPGTYNLVVSLPDFTTTTVPVTIPAGQTVTANVLLQPLPAAVTGTVTDASGVPLPGATIRLRSPFGVVLQEAVTNAAGQYTIPNIVPGNYTLLAEVNGYQSSLQGISLIPGQTLTVNFALTANPAGVAGRITSGGAPVPGALIEVLNQANQLVAAVEADANGNYALDNLAPGTYRLRVSAPNFSTEIIGFTVGPGETKLVNAELTPNPGTISGTAVDAETGLPLAGAAIRIVDQSGITLAAVLTDANGFYQVSTIPPGVYTVNFANDGYATQSIGAIVRSGADTVINAGLVKLAGEIAGSVTDENGTPLSDVTIRLFLNNIIIATVNTDQNGSYSIPGLAPGNYVIRAEAAGFIRELLGAAVFPFETTTVNFSLEPSPGILTGTVLGPDGAPLAGAAVTVRENTAVGPAAGRTITDASGVYIFSNLAPGSYIVTAEEPGFQIGSSGAIVAAEATTTINFVLQPSPGAVTGVVINALTGTPIISANIEIRIVSVNGAVLQTTFTDPNGIYLVTDLPPGSYGVVASAINFQTEAASLVVEPNVTQTVNLALQPNPGAITGSVLDAVTQAGLAGATVKVTDLNSVLVGLALTDSQGSFTVEGLRPGQYTVSAIQDGYQHNLIGAVVQSGLTTPVVLNLQPNPGSITGTVEPAPNGTLIQLFDVNNQFIAARIADPQGQFRFDDIAEGSYVITATAPNFITAHVGVSVRSNENSSVAVTLLPQPSTVSGTVTNEQTGAPITNATIRFLDENEVLVGIGTTDLNGFYETGNLPPGHLILVVTAPNYENTISGVSTLPGETLIGINFQLIPNPGAITGNITDSTNGLPIPGATVVIRSTDLQGIIIATVTTTLFGNYVVSGLAPGSYTVVASAEGYATETLGAAVASNVSTAANFVLNPLVGSITGLITGPNGEVLTGGTVQLQLLEEHGITLQTILTNPDGSFSFPNLLPGQYQVVASSPGFVNASVTVQVAAETIARADLSLSASPGTLNGTVTSSATGAPIAGAIITVRDPNEQFIDQGVSDENGFYRISRLPAGPITLSVSAPDFGSIGTGSLIVADQVTTNNLSLTPNPGVVSGFVTNLATGEPIASAFVEIFDAFNTKITTGLTDSSGFYQVNGLAPGSYTARAGATAFISQMVGFDVTPGGLTNASFALSPQPASVRGTVTDEITGRPITGATIDVYIGNTFGPSLATTQTDPEGNYLLTGLVPNNYVFVVTQPGYAAETNAAVLEANQEVVRNYVLSPLPSTVSGTVTDPEDGEPLEGASIRLTDDRGVVIQEVRTGSEGLFLIEGILPGEYTLVVNAEDRQSETVFLTLSRGETQNVSITPAPLPSSVPGQILQLQADGVPNPITGALVQILDENLVLIATAVTDATGGFTLPGLAPGVYTVTVSAPGFGSATTVVRLGTGQVAPPIVFQLHPNPGNLAGTVRDERRRPLFRVNVQVLTPAMVLVRQVITDPQGRYGVVGLAPGAYRVRFALEGKETQVRRIVIRAGETTVLNVILEDEADE
ncbi:carboxypeptidase regulatory-like domain-containing protein [Gorillibacterium sp. sgz5001074]|uniref:carboxypeptidase regulatory-like domain-containing protein n=1 Tax=Gorillibacterium sp. sgz5001074 TaxID=3446695 RepID=UPI003F67659D